MPPIGRPNMADYLPRALAPRSRVGQAAPKGAAQRSATHLVGRHAGPYDMALCGKQPGPYGGGWAAGAQPTATCARCLARHRWYRPQSAPPKE